MNVRIAPSIQACIFIALWTHLSSAAPTQFILFNIPHASEPAAFATIHRDFPASPHAKTRAGLAEIFSYLNQPRAQTIAQLKQFLRQSQTTSVPIVIQLDGENWWGARPDLWNFWDADRPGYSPANRNNVEWSSWSPDDAIKIAWRNWGQQIRVLPPPNLMSPAYRCACHQEMRVLIPLILNWQNALPANQKFLLVGIKLGWESSIGANAWYYPNGNALLNHPPAADPTTGPAFDNPPARGVAEIGYAAVKTAGLRATGQITEADLAEIVRRHLDDLCQLASELGVPREKLFTHVVGWKKNELLYQSGLNRFSCPGWSFYRHAGDPEKDQGVRLALQHSDAPYCAAVEWLYQGPRQTQPWRRALAATLALPRCRYLCIYNWQDVRTSSDIMRAIHDVINQSINPMMRIPTIPYAAWSLQRPRYLDPSHHFPSTA